MLKQRVLTIWGLALFLMMSLRSRRNYKSVIPDCFPNRAFQFVDVHLRDTSLEPLG